MEIRITTKHMLWIMYIISWVIFIGVGIEAGGFISNTVYTLFFNENGAKHFWPGFDLSNLYAYDKGYFVVETSLMSIVALLRTFMFYLIIRMLGNKKLSLSQPFSNEVRNFILTLAYLSIGIGLFSNWGLNYTEWLVNKGISLPSVQDLRVAGADVWLFMGVTLFVIAQIFKRGIEIQRENELTV